MCTIGMFILRTKRKDNVSYGEFIYGRRLKIILNMTFILGILWEPFVL
jgi:hypothetical protein